MDKLWNETCRMVERFRKTGASGQDFRAAVIKVFEQLGWSKEDDIALDLEIPIGATKSVNPDIVISNEGVNRYVVELKRPSAQIKSRDAEQLFSYMRLLQLDFGLLIGESLRFYYDDPSDTKQPVLIADVPFELNDEEGVEIFKLFSKRGFDVFGLTHYCEAVMTERKRQNRIKGIANTMCSLKGKRFIRDVVRAQLQKQYPADIVRDVMRRIDISAFLRDPADADKTEDEAMIEAATSATYVSGEAVEESAASPAGVNVEATIIEHPTQGQETFEETYVSSEPVPSEAAYAPAQSVPVQGAPFGAMPAQGQPAAGQMPPWGMPVQGAPMAQPSLQPQVPQAAEAQFPPQGQFPNQPYAQPMGAEAASESLEVPFQPQPYAQPEVQPQPQQQERPIEYRPEYQPRSSVQPSVQPVEQPLTEDVVAPMEQQGAEPYAAPMEAAIPTPMEGMSPQPGEQAIPHPMEGMSQQPMVPPMEQPMGQPFIQSMPPYQTDGFKSPEEP